MNEIYLDYAAATPVSQRVLARMMPYFSEEFANPGALHRGGQRAQAALDEAREDIAVLLGCDRKEIIFTASATESVNLAMRGVVAAARKEIARPHVITSAVEHSAVLATAEALAQDGVEVTRIGVDENGLVNPQDVASAMTENTVLVSIIYASNEVGTIQPIEEIAAAVQSHKRNVKSSQLAFHTDAVQAANYLEISPAKLGVDLMTISAQKIYGPKGAALLYKKEGVILAPQLTGGPQEHGLRAGTENVPAIAGFAEALKETVELKEQEVARLTKLREELIEALLADVPSAKLNGSRTRRLPNHASICFEGVSSDALIARLDADGVLVASGSACTSRTLEPTEAIVALGRPECARSSIRISLGRPTTQEDVERASATIARVVKNIS
ncbi:MAG: cysteine desulfurase family protein [Candidatus Spechtbacterales bacterium]